MSTLTNVIKENFDNYVRPVALGIKEVSLGLLEGLYTPFLMSTGCRRVCNSKSDAKFAVHTLSSVLTGYSIVLGGMVACTYEGRWKETLLGLGALVATNVVDYLQNTYRKAREIEEWNSWLRDLQCPYPYDNPPYGKEPNLIHWTPKSASEFIEKHPMPVKK